MLHVTGFGYVNFYNALNTLHAAKSTKNPHVPNLCSANQIIIFDVSLHPGETNFVSFTYLTVLNKSLKKEINQTL